MECEGALDDDDLRRVDVRVVLGTETRVRDKVIGRHGHGLSARALELVDHREQVVEVKLHSAQRARLRRPIGGLWVQMAAVADGVRMVEIILARVSSAALGVREVSVEAVHGDRNLAYANKDS